MKSENTCLELQPDSDSNLASGPRKITILCGRDKSLTHRAIIFAAMANGVSVIKDPLLGQDCHSTIQCFEELGVKAELNSQTNSLTIHSNGLSAFQQPSKELDCGNSGTTARLLIGLFAAIPNLSLTLTGDESLSKRPMRRVVEPLKSLGAVIEGQNNADFLPLSIHGRKLQLPEDQRRISIDKASAQIKSALLLAATQMEGDLELTLPAGSRDHTEIMLSKFGAKISRSQLQDEELIRFTGPWTPQAFHCKIPVDPSSAAFFAVYGLLRPQGELLLPEVLANPTRLGFLQVLQRMSKKISLFSEDDANKELLEPTCSLKVEGGQNLTATNISAQEVPSLIDEIPILAVAAAFAKGKSSFYGLSELRVKESDRLEKTAELLTAAGAKVLINGDDFHIDGGLVAAEGFHFDPAGDHRLAMAAAILAKRAKAPCRIKDPDCAFVSFPGFFEELERISGS